MNKMKSAIITGCLGQDGSILTNILIKHKVNVFGISKNYLYYNKKKIRKFDLLSKKKVLNLLKKNKPKYLFYFASFKHSSEEYKINNNIFNESYNVHVLGYKNFLDSLFDLKLNTKIFYASSSHIFGPQKFNIKLNEKKLFNPISPYGITKSYGSLLSRYYRKNYNLKIYLGILFNHESEYSSNKFILSKIINSAINIKYNNLKNFSIGSINTYIDLGYAVDYMNSVYRIINKFEPNDYIISSGKKIKIKTIIIKVFKIFDLDYRKYLKINKNIISNQKDLNLYGSNLFLKKTKINKNFHTMDQFIKKIIRFRLKNKSN